MKKKIESIETPNVKVYGATEICNNRANQTKIYQDSKQHGGSSVQQITRKVEIEFHLFWGVSSIVGFNKTLWNSGSETR